MKSQWVLCILHSIQNLCVEMCRVTVELDTHSSIEVMPDELGEEGQTDSEEVGPGMCHVHV